MLPISIVALISATLFTGAALYITLVEHPARLRLDDGPALAQWNPSYSKALPLQSGLAILGGVSGLAAWYMTGDWLWLAGSVAILLNWPFTLAGIMPTNKRLKTISPSAESRSLLLKWGKLHNVRSLLGAVATVLFGLACLNL
jgi:hypothetical protein